MSFQRLLPFSEAAQELGISKRELRIRIEAGTILAGIMPDGEIVVNMNSVVEIEANISKEDLPEYKKHADLQGIGIGINEAAKEHDIPQPTISNWFKRGYIREIARKGQKILIDAADVAYCAEIYRKRPGQGKWLFNNDGTPYEPKNREVPNRVAV